MLDRITTLHLNLCSSSLVIICLLTVLSGCCCKPSPSEEVQAAALHLTRPPHKHFQQLPGDHLHPARFYTCDQYQNPYRFNSIIRKKITRSNSYQSITSTQSKMELNHNDQSVLFKQH